MRNHTAIVLLVLLTVLSAGCSSSEKIHERAWMGAELSDVSDRLAELLAKKTERDEDALEDAVLVETVYANGPAHTAGLKRGDVILTAAGEPTDGAEDLRERLEAMAPGSTLALAVLRRGEDASVDVRLGRERYRRVGYISLGLSLSGRMKLIPTPSFDWFGLLKLDCRGDERLELRSAAVRAPRIASGAEDKPDGPGVASPEGWDFWMAIFGFGARVRVVTQEPVTE